MKRYALLAAAMIICICFAAGCEEKEQKARSGGDSVESFLIVTPEGALEEQTAHLIVAELEKEGYGAVIKYEEPSKKELDGYLGAVYVGIAPANAGNGVVRVSFRDGDNGDNTVSPSLSSKSFARAAVLLLPFAEHFSVISAEEGAQDVQDACDLLDMSGVDYTVEALDGRACGDAVFAAAEKGCDVLLLPTKELSAAGFDLSEYATAVFAVGEGEPVRGAFATFCIDAEKMAKDAAALAVSLARGEEKEPRVESYYILCISESASEGFETDIEAVSEDFRVTLVE